MAAPVQPVAGPDCSEALAPVGFGGGFGGAGGGFGGGGELRRMTAAPA